MLKFLRTREVILEASSKLYSSVALRMFPISQLRVPGSDVVLMPVAMECTAKGLLTALP